MFRDNVLYIKNSFTFYIEGMLILECVICLRIYNSAETCTIFCSIIFPNCIRQNHFQIYLINVGYYRCPHYSEVFKLAKLYAERELINLYIFHYKLLSWYACVAHLPFFILFFLISQCSDTFLLTIRIFFFLYSSIVFLYCNLLNLFQNSLSCPIFNNKLSICIRIHTSVNENTKRRVQAPHRDIVLWFRLYRVSQFIECVIQSFDSLSEALQIFASITTQILIRCATLIINNTEIAVIIIVCVFIELIVTVLANDICLGK